MASPVDKRKVPASNLSRRIPRLGTSVWLIVIVALFLIIMVPLISGYIDETAKQGVLRTNLSQLQARYDDLQKRLASQAAVETEVNKLKSDIATSRLLYRSIQDNPEISQVLMSLAWKYDITITGMTVNQVTFRVQGSDYPSLLYNMNLSGQVANFQNFLISIGNRFPTSIVIDTVIQPAQVQGELDKASVVVQILCPKE